MHYVIHSTDKSDSLDLRMETRPAHLEYIEAHRDSLYLEGQTLTEDGEAMTGSVVIVKFADRAGAEGFAANDPYAKAGLFENVTIQPWKIVIAPQ